METTDGSAGTGMEGPTDECRPLVRAHQTSEQRTVFTEPGNGDGWIATDLTIEPTQ
jgi:hypothetical protein